MQWYPQEFSVFCADLGSKLTSLRKAVLFELWQAKQPLKPYEILGNLHQGQQKTHATAVYRVLDYLCQAGIAHKLDSIQAYTLCHTPHAPKQVEVLMICQSCKRVDEQHSDKVGEVVLAACRLQAFRPDLSSIEVKGLCVDCSQIMQ